MMVPFTPFFSRHEFFAQEHLGYSYAVCIPFTALEAIKLGLIKLHNLRFLHTLSE